MERVYVKTLGCKVNTFDSHALLNQLITGGCVVADDVTHADVAIVNTCSVTANAEKEARYLARRFKRENPSAYVVLMGCYAQTDSARLSELPEVDFIVPNEVKSNAAQLIRDSFRHRGRGQKLPNMVKAVRNNRQSHFKASLTLFDKADSSRTRAFLKVQDGCNGFCTYCLIPYARGASISVPIAPITAEVSRLAGLGVPEIVLTGIHIGDWGRDLPEFASAATPIVTLLQELLAAHPKVKYRISSLEPREVSLAMMELMAANPDRFCPHFHLPLQSGSDPILKRMRREYTSTGYADAVTLVRRFFPEASIGADVIPGFPGETDDDHQATKAFIEEQQLSYLHVFPYSKRPNTAAARMPDHLDSAIVKDRAGELRALSQDLERRYYNKFLGRTLPVIWEGDVDAVGRQKGHTENYLNVVASPSLSVSVGELAAVRLKGLVGQSCFLAVAP